MRRAVAKMAAAARNAAPHDATGAAPQATTGNAPHAAPTSASQPPAPDAAPLMARNDESQPATVPDWVNETPGEDYEYELAIWLSGFSKQEISITREEYIALKRCLTEMRGMSAEV
jgi:hypothetical protein